MRRFDGHPRGVNSVALSAMGSGRELRILGREEAWIHTLAFSRDGNTLASGGGIVVLRLWEAPSQETVTADLSEVDVQAKMSRP